MTNEQLLQSITTVIVERFDMLDGRIERLEQQVDKMDTEFQQKFEQIDRKFEQIDQKFGQIDQKFEQIDQKFEQIDRKFEQIDRKFEQIDRKFEQIDQKFEQIDRKFEQIDQKFEQIDRKFEQIDQKFDQMDRKFEQIDQKFEQIDRRLEDNNESIFVQFNNEKVEDYRWGDDPKDTYEVLPAETVKKYLPEGYELVEGIYSVAGGETQDSYFVYAEVKKVLVEETQDVKINYYDEAAGKQVAEVPVQVSIDTSCVNMAILTRYLPEGYTLEGSDCIIRDGYVYVSVAPAEEVQNVKINYYDEAAKKQVAEVPVQVSIDTSRVNMAILTRYLPEGYTIEGTDCIIRDGYVYVSVAPAEEVQNVKINYYDEDAEKQVAEVPVQVSIDTSCVNMAILTRYMPEGYALVSSDCIIRDGYVYVSVKKDVEIREAVLHITFETPNGEVVTTETVTAEGADGEDAVFRLGVDFNLPTGYKLSNDRDQVTEIKIPFGSTGGHTMVVEKGDLSSIVKIQFVDAENNDEVVAGGDYFVDGDGDGIFHTREITEWVPEGYELQEVGDFQVELYKETPLQLSVTKIKEDKPETPDPEEPNKPEKPETPDQEKPEKPNKEDKKDEKKNSPKTGDETNAAAAALPAGVSLAAILAVLVKKFK